MSADSKGVMRPFFGEKHENLGSAENKELSLRDGQSWRANFTTERSTNMILYQVIKYSVIYSNGLEAVRY